MKFVFVVFFAMFILISCGGDKDDNSCSMERMDEIECRNGVIFECEVNEITYEAAWKEQYKCEDYGLGTSCNEDSENCQGIKGCEGEYKCVENASFICEDGILRSPEDCPKQCNESTGQCF